MYYVRCNAVITRFEYDLHKIKYWHYYQENETEICFIGFIRVEANDPLNKDDGEFIYIVDHYVEGDICYGHD